MAGTGDAELITQPSFVGVPVNDANDRDRLSVP